LEITQYIYTNQSHLAHALSRKYATKPEIRKKKENNVISLFLILCICYYIGSSEACRGNTYELTPKLVLVPLGIVMLSCKTN
jgi:hypothetical protein